MKNIYHILNGDALKEQFPKAVIGELIVTRECLVDGNVQGDSLTELFANRAKFLESYQEVPSGAYFKTTVPEITKIVNIPTASTIYCWFEDDLFCQVNFWFVMHLLVKNSAAYDIHLVRPSKGNEYSFGHMSESELTESLQQAVVISNQDQQQLSKLWCLYQQKNYEEMLVIANNYYDKFNFLAPAIKAQVDRIPDASGYGRPERAILEIMAELDTKEFSPVFRLFHQREGIYSFGDLQVKRMFDELLKR